MARDGNKDFRMNAGVRMCYAEMCASGLFTEEQLHTLRWGLRWENGSTLKNMKLVSVAGLAGVKEIAAKLPPKGVYMTASKAARATGYDPKQIQHECFIGKIECYRIANVDGVLMYQIPYKTVMAIRKRRVAFENRKAQRNGKKIKVS